MAKPIGEPLFSFPPPKPITRIPAEASLCLEAEKRFLKAFLEAFYKCWPGMKTIHKGLTSYTADHEDCQLLASELGWAGTWCSKVMPSLHWEEAFGLDQDAWEAEAKELASAPLKVSPTVSPSPVPGPQRPIFKCLPENVRPSKPRPGTTLQTAIDVDLLDEDCIEKSLRELEEGLIIQRLPAKKARIVPTNLTFF
ncbi:hypothetical protein H1R20_g758, partial [Candolleomyces eurysporus]